MDRFLPAESVERLADLLNKAGISVTVAAEEIGVNRSGLSQMLNGKQPMRRAYGLALRGLITSTVKARTGG